MKRLLIIIILAFTTSTLLADVMNEYTAELEWSKTGFSSFIDGKVVSARFPSEPDIESTHEIIRFKLHVGYNNNKTLNLIYDFDTENIYVDSNLDGDLTNDTEGTYKVTSKKSGRYVTFSKLINIAGKSYALNFYIRPQRTAERAYAICRSAYWGQVQLEGDQWYVAIVDTPDGQLTRAETFGFRKYYDVEEGKLPGFRFYYHDNMPNEVLVGSKSYSICYSYSDDNKASITFTETQPETGIIKFDVNKLHSLILVQYTDNFEADRIAFPDFNNIQELPLGKWYINRILLDNGIDQPCLGYFNDDRYLVVDKANPTEFVAGTPLKHSVSITRFRNNFNIDYELTGKGGEKYLYGSLLNDSQGNQPKLEIYKGDRLIHSGEFEYG